MLQIYHKKTARLEFHIGFILIYCAVFSYWIVHRFPAIFTLPCPIKATFSIPCPSCGSGRVITALLNFQLGDAFVANPLFFLILALSAIYCSGAVMQLTTGYRIMLIRTKNTSWFVSLFGIIAVLANYYYLLMQ
ncbi:MAG: DUF2752 domain-containing protein [Calditrichaeota bacterium]|nr:MAG: DUF2752 domain-containing protein [Calditrichota bacterium]